MKEEAFPDIYMMTSSRSLQDILLLNMFPNILISVYILLFMMEMLKQVILATSDNVLKDNLTFPQ